MIESDNSLTSEQICPNLFDNNEELKHSASQYDKNTQEEKDDSLDEDNF